MKRSKGAFLCFDLCLYYVKTWTMYVVADNYNYNVVALYFSIFLLLWRNNMFGDTIQYHIYDDVTACVKAVYMLMLLSISLYVYLLSRCICTIYICVVVLSKTETFVTICRKLYVISVCHVGLFRSRSVNKWFWISFSIKITSWRDHNVLACA